ncbi:MAG: electron transport complex subunit RsxA [Clostridia bacterium]|jgi:electron transport complex protein RnfA|nr:electron transport complex subunit RsxA [Clostridia bacterium]
MREMILIIISAVLINNIVLSQFLGVCPFLGVSKKLSSAIGMGAAVIFVLTLSSLITWVVQIFVLDKLGIGYLQTIAFILVIAALVQFVEMVMKKNTPDLYKALGVYLPLITTNCAVLGVAIINIQKSYTFMQTLANSIGNGIGFTLALIIFAGIRERLEEADVPMSLNGLPIALITAALMSISFLGFTGLL